MVEEVENSPVKERRRGEVRGTRFQMHGSEHLIEKHLLAIHRSSSSDARPVCINGTVSTFFTEKEPTETKELKPFRANSNIQSTDDGRPRAKKKRAASRNSSALGQERAARPRNMNTFQPGAKEKGAARKNGVIGLSAFYLGSAILACLVGGTEAAADVITTRQKLPPDCIQLLKEHHNDCPDRADPVYAPLWGKLNALCCDDYPGKFHCQFKNENGTTNSMPACIQNQTVPIGKLGLLNIKDGYPKLDLNLDCPSGTFRDHAVDSTFIRHWYCDSTKAKEEAGEEKWCDGGPSADDIFICRIGYYAENCPHGRNNSHDACPCQQFRNGSRPFRKVNGTCDSSIYVIYGSTFPVSTLGMSTSTPSYNTQLPSSASGDGEIKSTTPWITKPDRNSSNHNYGVLGPVLGVAVALVAFGLLVYFCYLKPRRNSSLLEQEKMFPDSGSSSKDDSGTFDMSLESE